MDNFIYLERGQRFEGNRQGGVSLKNSILQLFPLEYRGLWQQAAGRQESIQEIRLRAGRQVILHMEGREFFLTGEGEIVKDGCLAYRMDGGTLDRIFQHICNYSPYAFEEELKQGFLTVEGGHRVGVAGQAVLEPDGSVRTLKNITFLNIRVAHQVKGAADGVLPRLYRGGRLKNTLIISPPGCGKTTLLRDIIRQVSDGNAFARGMTVGVVDERSELGGSFMGKPQNDMGMRTDVLDGCPKAVGMLMLLRSMAPEVLAIDELGSLEELDALRRAASCGCRILATAHGESLEEVRCRFGGSYFRDGCFGSSHFGMDGRPDMERGLGECFGLYLVLGREGGRCVVRQVLEGGEAFV